MADRAAKDWQGGKHCSPLCGGQAGQRNSPARPYESSFVEGGRNDKISPARAFLSSRVEIKHRWLVERRETPTV